MAAPFIYAFAFCFPRGDDFDSATRAMFFGDLPGAFYEVGREWLTWSGRYTYHFLAVFFGKAVEGRLLYGLVCFSVPMLFYWAMRSWLGLYIKNASECRFYAFLTVIIIFTCHACLDNFYLFTDALTISLQAACSLMFLAMLCRLWHTVRQAQNPYSSQWRWTLFMGILAIGVYEHAALAVFWMSATALLYAVMQASSGKNWNGFAQAIKLCFANIRIRPIATLFLWLLAPLAISFLAPGNLSRNHGRGMDAAQQCAQLANAPGDWLHMLGDFGVSSWILPVICLALLCRWQSDNSWRPDLRLCPLILGVFLIFSFCVTVLQAMSDVPLSAALKLQGSLEFYAALTLGVCVFICAGRLKFSPSWSGGHAFKPLMIIPLPALMCLTGLTDNFMRTSSNAANGQMLELARFMEVRQLYLRDLELLHKLTKDPTGIYGELVQTGVRRRKVDPGRPVAEAQKFLWPVFPVYMAEALNADMTVWPNLWAAWMYNQGAIRALPPDPIKALAAIKSGHGNRLRLPKALREAGWRQAWLVDARGGGNATFDNHWLVVKFGDLRDGHISILCAAAPDKFRLLPVWLQRILYGRLRTCELCGDSWITSLAANRLDFSIKIDDASYMAMPLGGFIPDILFANMGGMLYHKLRLDF